MSIETNDGGLLKALGSLVIPATGGQPCGFIGTGVRSLAATAPGIVAVELVEAIGITEFHALATYGSANTPDQAASIVVSRIDDTHFQVNAAGAIAEDLPVAVFIAIRRITPASVEGVNPLPVP
jgi:hypothetical protein